MSIFDSLSRFYETRHATLKSIQDFIFERSNGFPTSVLVSAWNREEEGIFLNFSRAWGEDTFFLFCVDAEEVTRLSDYDICLLVAELFSIGEEAAAAMVDGRVDVARRASLVRSLVQARYGELRIWSHGGDYASP